uniref:Secreted protein n=1 Tax=Acrobeloides nanus TaxID=290746 RepID=A0A914CQM3_9BILA
MKWLTLVALAGLLAYTTAQGKGGNCTIAAFKIAQDVFTSQLGLPPYYDWQDPIDLLVGVQNTLVNGLAGYDNGLIAVCRSFNAMLNNLASNNVNIYTCFEPLFIMSQDNTPENAYAYVATMKMIAFNCGGGFYTALKNWPCIQNAYQTQNTTLFSAITSMLQQIADTPDRACAYTKNALLTWTTAFDKVCNQPDTEYYGCQTMLQFTNTWYPICNDVCYVPTRQQALVEFGVDDKEYMKKLRNNWAETRNIHKPVFHIDLESM